MTTKDLTTIDVDTLHNIRVERMLRMLASDLADMVRSGDITEHQANEWMVDKQDQWLGGDR